MTNQKKDIATQAGLDEVRAARTAARLKASELTETLEEEQHKAQAAEMALNEADRVVRDCLQNSLTAQKKVNSILSQTIAAMKDVENLTKKEKAVAELMKDGQNSKK